MKTLSCLTFILALISLKTVAAEPVQTALSFDGVSAYGEKGPAQECAADFYIADGEITSVHITGYAVFKILFTDADGSISSVGTAENPRYQLSDLTFQDKVFGVVVKKTKTEYSTIFEVFNGDNRIQYVELEFDELGFARSVNYQTVTSYYGGQQKTISGNCLRSVEKFNPLDIPKK